MLPFKQILKKYLSNSPNKIMTKYVIEEDFDNVISVSEKAKNG